MPSPRDDAIRRAHDAAVAAGEPGYADPETGFFVFTAATLAANGSCCDSGCRHCPYEPHNPRSGHVEGWPATP